MGILRIPFSPRDSGNGKDCGIVGGIPGTPFGPQNSGDGKDCEIAVIGEYPRDSLQSLAFRGPERLWDCSDVEGTGGNPRDLCYPWDSRNVPCRHRHDTWCLDKFR